MSIETTTFTANEQAALSRITDPTVGFTSRGGAVMQNAIATTLQGLAEGGNNAFLRNAYSSANLSISLSTLDEIVQTIEDEVFFTLEPAMNFIPTSILNRPVLGDLIYLRYKTLSTNDRFAGDTSKLSARGGVIPSADTSQEQMKMAARVWRRKATWDIFEQQLSNVNGLVDTIRIKLSEPLRYANDVLQYLMYNGHPDDTSITGFFNGSGVTLQASNDAANPLGNVAVDTMTVAQLENLAKRAKTQWMNRSRTNLNPTHFIIPATHAAGLGARIDVDGTIVTRGEYLQRQMSSVFPGITIIPHPFADRSGNFGDSTRSTSRYALVHATSDVLEMNIPLPFRFLPVLPSNFEFSMEGFMQYSGVTFKRPEECVYMDTDA